MEDYKILEASNAKDLEREVMKYLSLGYLLAGGHQVTVASYDYGDNSLNMKKRDPKTWSVSQVVYKLPSENKKRKEI